METGPERITVKLPYLRVASARDPFFENTRWTWAFVPLADYERFKEELFNVNARRPNVNRKAYEDLKKAIERPQTFHFYNGGAEFIAESTRIDKSSNSISITCVVDRHGLINGGHTSEAIWQKREELNGSLPQNCVLLTIKEDIPEELQVVDISRARNTAVQVQARSLDDLAGKFEPLKKALTHEPYSKEIAYRESDAGKIDVRDILAKATALQSELFPVQYGQDNNQPVMAYEKVSACLDLFEEHRSSYEGMYGILPDILRLYDALRSEYRKLHNDAGGKAGRLAFSVVKKKKLRNGTEKIVPQDLPYLGEQAEYVMHDAIAIPMLAAFRSLVIWRSGKAEWKGGFGRVLKLWRKAAPIMIRAAADAFKDSNYNFNAVGKNRTFWRVLELHVQTADLHDSAH